MDLDVPVNMTYAWTFAKVDWAIFGQAIAKKNAGRWSKTLHFAELIKDLEKDPQALKENDGKSIILAATPGVAELDGKEFDTFESLRQWHRRFHHLDAIPVLAVQHSKQIYNEECDDKWRVLDHVHSTQWGINVNNGGVIFLAFRGTKTVIDVAKDIKCIVDTTNPDFNSYGLGVHQSLLHEITAFADIIYGQLCEEAKGLRATPMRRLVITGHSMGGGLAFLFHAYMWLQVKNKRWPKPADANDPQVKSLFDTTKHRCFAFAGPSVFAPRSDMTPQQATKCKELDEYMQKSATNYILHDDAVPRAYADLDAEALLKLLGKELTANVRYLQRVGLVTTGLGGLLAVAALSNPGLGLLALGWTGIGSGATAVTAAQLIARSTKDITDLETVLRTDLKQFNEHAKKYKMCGQIVLMRNHQCHSWRKFHLSVQSLSFHSISLYREELIARMKSDGFQKSSESLLSSSAASHASTKQLSEKEVQDQAEAMYEKAKNSDKWDPLIDALQGLPQGFIDRIILKRRWHFIHQAMYHQNLNVVKQLLDLGADFLREVENGGTTDFETESVKPYLNLAKAYRQVGYDTQTIAILVSDAIGKKICQADEKLIAEGKLLNLIRLGYSEEQVRAVKSHGKDFEELLEALRKAYPEQEQQEERHRFLDAAKFMDWQQLMQMLDKKPELALTGTTRMKTGATPERWTALMQLAFTGGPKDVAKKLLDNYEDAEALTEALENNAKVEDEMNAPAPAEPTSSGASKFDPPSRLDRGAQSRAAPAASSTPVTEPATRRRAAPAASSTPVHEPATRGRVAPAAIASEPEALKLQDVKQMIEEKLSQKKMRGE